MNKKSPIPFPQYRKYPNDKVYFKITSEDSWEEVHLVGNRRALHTFKARILPERNFVQDMLYDYVKNWEKIEEEEYVNVKLLVTD